MKKGIIKSGNTGNSAKSSKSPPPPPPPPPPEAEKPLFPPGFKYPLSLLHERCQKAGWEKPSVETPKHSAGYSFVVHLARINKKTSERETVRLHPKPLYFCPSALEARHWGATYALYRFCNSIQLNRVLPPGPREYWNTLASEHKNAPAHLQWLYAADPFAAQEAEYQRRKATTESIEKRPESRKQGRPSPTPMKPSLTEVRMSSKIREIVDDAIKKGISMFPEAAVSHTESGLLEEEALDIHTQLVRLGFKPAQATKATEFFQTPSALAGHLLHTSSNLEAMIEYLVLHIPECDLPERFMPSNGSSEPFIRSAHTGKEDLKRRWLEDKAVNQGGWPRQLVQSCLKSLGDDHLDVLIGTLCTKLVEENTNRRTSNQEPYTINNDEAEALDARFADQDELVMPLFSAPIRLHILIGNTYPRPNYAPMFISSASVPPYIRLHLLSRLLVSVQDEAFVQPGEGFFMAAMRILEEEWAEIEAHGPPDISTVMQQLYPTSSPAANQQTLQLRRRDVSYARSKQRRATPQDDRDDVQIKREFDDLCRNEKYIEMLSSRKRLPAFAVRQQFLNCLDSSRVIIVVGETGSGKTTQLPQFVLDSLISTGLGSKTSIVVTQPRRLSAISVAARVSAERLDDGSVGYAIRGESKVHKKTKLLFCTTGVVLRRLSAGDGLRDVSHVIVDEVHERSVDGDLLLLELKELLHQRPTLKVILMSATINHEVFIKYFNDAPFLSIPGATYPVKDHYLEDVLPLVSYRPSQSKSRSDKNEASSKFRELYQAQGLEVPTISALQTLSQSDRVDHQLIAAVTQYIISSQTARGGILIFLPGVQEIRQCIEALRKTSTASSMSIFPLHANLSNDEQRRVFSKTKDWKVIVATNVAETSITIDDVVYVIDSGKVKETRYNAETNISQLVETFVTRAAAKQRRGRAGRTQPGICYKLYTRSQEQVLAAFPVPEMARIPLENVVLSVKAVRDQEDIALFLSRAIDPPKMDALDNALETLTDVGAIDNSGKLTSLGRHLVMLPMDLRLGKMLILGTIFQCLDPIATVVASLSAKPLFYSPMDKRDEALRARKRFSYAQSDLLTDVKAYEECARLRVEGKSQKEILAFCEENFISPTTVREITALRNEFISLLADIGFVPFNSTASSSLLNVNSGNVNLLKGIMLGGLWPRVARVKFPDTKYDKVQAGTVARESQAREFKLYDHSGRVFLHPTSILFDETSWKSSFIVYFHKYESKKVYLRDASTVPLYGLLLFGGPVSNSHRGGLAVGNPASSIPLAASPRIGVLVNQLRRLLDAQLASCIEGTVVTDDAGNVVLRAMMALLENDGLTEL